MLMAKRKKARKGRMKVHLAQIRPARENDHSTSVPWPLSRGKQRCWLSSYVSGIKIID